MLKKKLETALFELCLFTFWMCSIYIYVHVEYVFRTHSRTLTFLPVEKTDTRYLTVLSPAKSSSSCNITLFIVKFPSVSDEGTP